MQFFKPGPEKKKKKRKEKRCKDQPIVKPFMQEPGTA